MEECSTPQKAPRIAGIELLRILSMVMVTILHTLGNGGILANANTENGQYQVAWLLETASFCAVNCYALISGYVGIFSKHKTSRIVLIWAQTIFYSLGITAVYSFKHPELMNESVWKMAIFPITCKQYWYVTAYFLLFLIMPILNAGINALSEKQLRLFVIVSFVAVSVLPYLLLLNRYELNNGYSAMWLVLMYVYGAYFRKYNVADKISKRVCGLIYALAVLFSWIHKLVLQKIPSQVSRSGVIINYVSPTIIVAGVALLLLFAKIDFQNKVARKIVFNVSSCTLGVFLIHVHQLPWKYLVKDYALGCLDHNAFVMAVTVLGYALALYLICTVIEYARIWLFKLLHIDTAIQKIDNYL